VLSIHAIGRGYAHATNRREKHGVNQTDRMLSNGGFDTWWSLFRTWTELVIGPRRDHVDVLAPVHDEPCRRAASGRVLHNDDTSVRILELMGKRRTALLEHGALPDPEHTGLFTTGVVSITEAGLVVPSPPPRTRSRSSL